MRQSPEVARIRNPIALPLILAVLPLLLLQSALAGTFNVNSTADILTPPTGVVTLRSAIQAANTTAGGSTINLTIAGDYKITIPGANTGTNNSGAFAILPSAGNVTIVNTSGGTVVVDGNLLDRVFDINPAASSSPAFSVSMQGFTITNGLAEPGSGAPGSGGGIRAQGVASLTLSGMIVTGNQATADGGGIAMENVAPSTWVLTIGNTTISANHAGASGGGIESDGPGSIVLNGGAVVSGNSAAADGGGVFLDPISEGTTLVGANLVMNGAVIAGNQALGSTAVGGGIANAGNGTVTVNGSLVQHNSAGGSGGGFADPNCKDTLTVSLSAVLANTTSGNGGAITDCGSVTTIGSSEIDGNSAGGSGGAIFAAGTTLTIASSTLADNTASGDGGGIELQTTGTGSTASSITNSTITGNSVENNSGGNGGGIDAPASFTGLLTVENATLSSNASANGGGIFWAGAAGSTIAAVDTILATNRASSVGPDANNSAGSFTDDGGNLIGISGAGSGNTGFTAGTTQSGTVATPLNPLLGALQNNGGPTLTQALLTGSPAIDKALTTSVTVDERGVPRPQGPKYDIGAEEANQGPTPLASVSAAILDFGTLLVGKTATQELSLANTGTGTLTLGSVTLSGADTGDFTLTPPAACLHLPAKLLSGASCLYTVKFGPLATGSRTAQIIFNDNTFNAPNSEQTVALSGTGLIKAASSVSLTLTAGSNPSGLGAALTFTATVTPDTATGTVNFIDGTTVIATGTLSSGIASFTTSSLAIGSHSITAHYLGDAFDTAATSTALVEKILAATSTSVASSLNPSVVGQSVTFTATVTPGTATGTVNFLDGTTVIGSGTLSAGTAAFATSSLAAGSHSITAHYLGDALDASSTSTTLVQEVSANSSTALASSLNPSVVGQNVTFTATVTPATATGTVNFLDGAAVIGSGTLSGGKAAFATTSLAAGSHSITAHYLGDTLDTPSTSTALVEKVLVATSTSLASSANPSGVGQSVTFTATVTPGTPTGTVNFLDGTTVIGTGTLMGGIASFATSSLAAGSHSITAHYLGDPFDAASTSTALVEKILAATSTSLASSANPANPGQSVTFTATVTPGTAAGTVNFLDGTTVIGSGTLSGGKASFATSALAAGTHSITAHYVGNALDAPSTSTPLLEEIAGATSTSLAASLNPSVVGQNVTFTATVTSALPAITGTVTFMDGATVLGTGTVTAGQATFSTFALTVGAHSITAVYSGDTTHAKSTSKALAYTVDQSATSTAIAASLNPIVFGQSVTFTATVTAVAPGSGTPTGTVTFKDGTATLGTGTLSAGFATFATSTLNVSTHHITAVYGGSTNYQTSTSPVLLEQVF